LLKGPGRAARPQISGSWWGARRVTDLGDGRLDFAIARQWAAAVFYANESPALGNYLGLQLFRPSASGGQGGQGLSALGAPAYGTTVQVYTPGHTQVSQLDGGSGSAGKRSCSPQPQRR
jgi:enediyne biosynthesis protein E4